MKLFTQITLFLGVLILSMQSCDQTFNNIPAKYHPLLTQSLEKAGANSQELKMALQKAPKEQKEGIAFLISYMPERDLKELKASFILENAQWAYHARETFAWTKELPDSIFFNEVLPYASLNERRDNWRKDFYTRFSKYVQNCTTIEEAITAVNKNIKDVVKVEYNTKREKPDQSPYESMKQGMASCSGLSILLTDAFRAVGIPSRIAGTPNWWDKRGNHNWNEVWINGKWYFTEYYPSGLNKSWFLPDAGKADPTNTEHMIYASSFKPTKYVFPLVWDFDIKYVFAHNVTHRYIEVYNKEQEGKNLKEDETMVKVILLKQMACSATSDSRVEEQVYVYRDEKKIDSGHTPGPYDDMNKFLKFRLKKNTLYTFSFPGEGGTIKELEVKTTQEPSQMIKLYMKQ